MVYSDNLVAWVAIVHAITSQHIIARVEEVIGHKANRNWIIYLIDVLAEEFAQDKRRLYCLVYTRSATALKNIPSF